MRNRAIPSYASCSPQLRSKLHYFQNALLVGIFVWCQVLVRMALTKRKKRAAKRSATFTKSSEAGTWDDTARSEYLTGFRKRKRERRVKGHAHAALKERQAKLETRVARRARADALLKRMPEQPLPLGEKQQATVRYDDSELMDQWGSQVTVTTTLGLDVLDESPELPSPVEKRVDVAQLRAGSFETMCKKVAATLGKSAKSSRRAALRRDRKAAARGGKTLGRPTKRSTRGISSCAA